MINQKTIKDRSHVWIRNSHGVVSCKEAWLAKELLRTHHDWEYCEPEDVPETKAHPSDGGSLTEEGARRRTAARASEEEAKPKGMDYSMRELRKIAKEDGVLSFGKTKAALIEELKLN